MIFLKRAKQVLNNEDGQGMAEYGLIIALIAIAVIGAMIFLGSSLSAKFKGIGTTINDAKSIE